MRKILVLLLILLGVNSCKTSKVVTQPILHDTTIVREIQEIHDTTVYYVPPIEKIVNVTKDTISRVETSLAVSVASVKDGQLYHSIAHKNAQIPIDIQYVDRVVEKEVIREIPIEVIREKKVVPKWCKILLKSNLAYLMLAVCIHLCMRYKNGIKP